MSGAFVKEDSDQQERIERMKMIREREQLLVILEKKRTYLLSDPKAATIDPVKRRSMLESVEEEIATTRNLIEESKREPE